MIAVTSSLRHVTSASRIKEVLYVHLKSDSTEFQGIGRDSYD